MWPEATVVDSMGLETEILAGGQNPGIGEPRANRHPRLMEEHEVKPGWGDTREREYGRCGDDGNREVVKSGRP